MRWPPNKPLQTVGWPRMAARSLTARRTREGDKMSDLKKRVEDWLGTQGYPLEFATAAAFRQHGFDVQQGTFARDPEEGISREIDILASMTERGDSSSSACTSSSNVNGRSTSLGSSSWRLEVCHLPHVSRRRWETRPPGCFSGPKQGTRTFRVSASFKNQISAGFGGRQALSDKKDVFYGSHTIRNQCNLALVTELRSCF